MAGIDSSTRGAAPTQEQTIWNIPNQLTIARLVLSVVFFVILALETHWNRSAAYYDVVISVVFFVVGVRLSDEQRRMPRRNAGGAEGILLNP